MATPPTPTPPTPPDPNAAAKAETDRLKAETDLEKARAERIKALGLPSFEGKTTLKDGAGAIEGLILATDALFNAATLIAEAAVSARRPGAGIHDGPFLILAGEEQIDFGLASAIRAEIEAFEALFPRRAPTRVTRALPLAGLGAPVAAISAIAGLLRTDSEISGLAFAELSHRMLATATAGRLGFRAILPSAAIGRPPAGNPLADRLMALAARRDALAAAARPDAAASLARFDAFYARVTTPDTLGQIPIARAGRLEQLLDQQALVLRVFAEKAGGSLINRKNIWTFIGFDPVKVSAGLVASYTITDPATGQVLAAEVLNCRTTEASLENIQKGRPVSTPKISSSGRDGGHASRQTFPPSLLAQAGGATMASTNAQRATTAIEAWIREYRREDIAIWRTRVPSTHFGLPGTAWRDVGRNIIEAFNAVEPVVATIDPTEDAVDNAIRNLHARPLGEFHQYIVDKAEAAQLAASSRTIGDGEGGQ